MNIRKNNNIERNSEIYTKALDLFLKNGYDATSMSMIAETLGMRIDLSFLDKIERQVEEVIETFYAKFPPEMKEEYDQRKFVAQTKPGTITIQAQLYIDDRFKKGGDEDGERPV